MTPQKENSYSKIEETFSLGEVTHLQEITQKVFNEALCQIYTKVTPSQQSLELEYLFQNEEFFQSFKCYLAKAVAQTVGTNDRQVQAVYLFEPSLNPDVETGEDLPLEATVHLLVVVSKPSAALDAFIEALDQELARCLNQMPCLYWPRAVPF